MAEVTWFKVLTDMFADDKIKIIQSMPEGDSILVMWFKVLSQAGKTNDGGYIYLRKSIPYTPAMLATLFNKQQMMVELALKTFEQFEMIDIDENGYIFVTNWEKHQSIDKLNLIKEKTRLRVQSHRDKKKQELLTSNATVTLPKHPSNAIDIELELDLELEKEIPKDSNSISMRGQNPFALYGNHGFGKLNEISAQFIDETIKDYTEDWVKRAMIESIKIKITTWKYVEGILKRWKSTGHPEPWTLEKEEPKQQQSFRNSYNKQQSPRMSVVKDDVPAKEVNPEEREKMRELVRKMKEESA